MFDRFNKTDKRQQLTLGNFGNLKLFSTGQDWYWFGTTKNISPDNHPIELTINVDDKNQLLTEQTELIKEFTDNYEQILTVLYKYMKSSFAKTSDVKAIDDLKKMYFLSSIELKKDNKEWWVVFEPQFDIETIYNFLQRFTLIDMKVTWSNLR